MLQMTASSCSHVFELGLLGQLYERHTGDLDLLGAVCGQDTCQWSSLQRSLARMWQSLALACAQEAASGRCWQHSAPLWVTTAAHALHARRLMLIARCTQMPGADRHARQQDSMHAARLLGFPVQVCAGSTWGPQLAYRGLSSCKARAALTAEQRSWLLFPWCTIPCMPLQGFVCFNRTKERLVAHSGLRQVGCLSQLARRRQSPNSRSCKIGAGRTQCPIPEPTTGQT